MSSSVRVRITRFVPRVPGMSNFPRAAAFQPAPLVIATHVSFALLQTTFLVLLSSTRSWNFVFLNSVCGGLWAGITWFLREVAEMEKFELEADRLRKLRIKRDKEAKEREEAWSVQQVEETGEMGSLSQDGQNRGTDGGCGRAEGKKVR